MLKVYLSVIHALLTLTDTCRYHAQLLMVTGDIDIISVVFIRNKLLKLHAPMSIHTTGISLGVFCDCSLFVWGHIYIKNFDGMFQISCLDLLVLGKILINKIFSSSSVQ